MVNDLVAGNLESRLLDDVSHFEARGDRFITSEISNATQISEVPSIM